MSVCVAAHKGRAGSSCTGWLDARRRDTLCSYYCNAGEGEQPTDHAGSGSDTTAVPLNHPEANYAVSAKPSVKEYTAADAAAAAATNAKGAVLSRKLILRTRLPNPEKKPTRNVQNAAGFRTARLRPITMRGGGGGSTQYFVTNKSYDTKKKTLKKQKQKQSSTKAKAIKLQ